MAEVGQHYVGPEQTDTSDVLDDVDARLPDLIVSPQLLQY